MKFIFQILLISIGAVAFFTYIIPQYKQVSVLKAQVVEYDNALDNSKELQQKRDEILSSYNSITMVNKERINRLLPDLNEDSATSGSIALALEIDEIATKSGLKITNLGFSSPTVSNSAEQSVAYSSSMVTFNVQASYIDFISFIQDLEKNLRVVDMRSISFSAIKPSLEKEKEIINTNLFEYHVQLQAYWLNI